MFDYGVYKALRDRNGLTDYQVEKNTGVHTGSLNSWAAGKSEPKYQTIHKLAVFFGTTEQMFIEED